MSYTPPSGLLTASRRGRGGREGGVFLLVMGVLMTVMFGGCATKGDVRALQDVVEAQASRQDGQLERLAAEIQALQDTLEIQSGMVVDTRGGIARELRDMQDTLSRLMALTGQIQREVTLLSNRFDAQASRVTPMVLPGNPDSVGVPFDVGGADPAGADGTYQAAIAQLNRGSLGTARRAFESFLVDYPDHRLAPSARFFLGDVFEQENQLDDATEAFLRIPELYPTDDRVPQALYRVGAIYALKENVAEAVRYLETVVNTYPDSGAADLAQELLQELR
jgi:tol-pal system protein YbgF